MKLTPDDLERIKTKNVANILRQQGAGKPLSAREEAVLAAYVAGEDPPAGGFAKSWDELADACSIDRRTLTNARQAHALLIKKRGPQLTRADGRHSIAEWQRLLAEVGVHGRGLNDPESTLVDERALKLRLLAVAVKDAEWSFDKKLDAHLPVSQFESALRVMLTAFHASLEAFAGRANPRLEGLDYDARSEVLEHELNILRRTLAQCAYLGEEGSVESLKRESVASDSGSTIHDSRSPPLTAPAPVCPPKKRRAKKAKAPASAKKPAPSSSRSSAPSSRPRRK